MEMNQNQTGPAIIEAPRLAERGIVSAVLKGLQSLLGGMKITIGYFLRPSTVITQQYPENRETLKMFDRARIQLTMAYDENGYHACNACSICEGACPNGSITVVERKGPTTGKKEIDQYVWRMDSCTFCNMCVMVCPSSALKMSDTFEASVYDRRLLVFNLNRYAGPTAKELVKIESSEERAKLMEPRTAYSGPVPLRGRELPGLPVEDFHAAGIVPPAPPAPAEEVKS